MKFFHKIAGIYKVSSLVIFAVLVCMFPLSSSGTESSQSSILIPPDPEDLIHGYALIEKSLLADLNPERARAEFDSLKLTTDIDPGLFWKVNEKDIPRINTEKLGFENNTDLKSPDRHKVLIQKLDDLSALEINIHQISYAELLLHQVSALGIRILEDENLQDYTRWKKIGNDLQRVMYSASISTADLWKEIEYNSPDRYIESIPENICAQLENSKVRFSELKRLNIAVNELFELFNEDWDSEYSLKSARLLNDLEIVKRSFERDSKQPSASMTISDLVTYKDNKYYPETLIQIAEQKIDSGNQNSIATIENLLQDFIQSFPEKPETQLAYILLGEAEITKNRPDLDRAISHFTHGKNWPSLRYRARAIFLESEWRFTKDDPYEIDEARSELSRLIRNYKSIGLESEWFEKSVVLLAQNIIESNHDDFEKSQDDIADLLSIPNNDEYNEAVKTIYLETLYSIYPGIPDVNKIIQRTSSEIGFNPRLELLKINCVENISGDYFQGYSRRKTVLEELESIDSNPNHLLIEDKSTYQENLHFQTFELAVFLSNNDKSCLTIARNEANTFLEKYPESPLAGKVAINKTELMYSSAISKEDKVQAVQFALESLKYIDDREIQNEVLTNVISRIIADGYNVNDDMNDAEIVSLLSGSIFIVNKIPTLFTALLKALILYIDGTKNESDDGLSFPIAASSFANEGYYMSAGYLYKHYIENNPGGKHLKKVIDGYFSVFIRLQDYDELSRTAELILTSDQFSPEIKSQVRKYKGELEILIAKKLSMEGEERDSEQILVSAVKENPSAGTSASALFELAIKAEEDGRLQEAQDYILTLIDIYPESQLLPEALQNYSYLLEKQMRVELGEGHTSITREDLAYAFLKAARISSEDSKRNALYYRAMEYFKYVGNDERELEAIRGFHNSNKKSTNNSLALNRYSSLLWRMNELAELDSIADVMTSSNNIDMSSQATLYMFLMEIKKGNQESAEEILNKYKVNCRDIDNINNGNSVKLLNLLETELLENKYEPFFASIGEKNQLSINEYKKLKDEFDTIKTTFDLLLEIQSVNTISSAIKIAGYEKLFAESIKKMIAGNASNLMMIPEQNERLNLAIAHYENAINYLEYARQKLDIIQAVFDTMTIKTGRNRDVYWDFLGIYSYGIKNQYPYFSEVKILEELKNTITSNSEWVINETLSELQDLIRNLLEVRSPGRDELSIIYYDYSVLNELVLPRFKLAGEIYQRFFDSGENVPEQISDFTELFIKILNRNIGQQDRLFLGHYEPGISSLNEKIQKGYLPSENEINTLLDLQELMSDFVVTGLKYSSEMMAINLNDNLLMATSNDHIEGFVRFAIEQVRRSSRITSNLRKNSRNIIGEESYLMEDLLTGNRETEKRILLSLWFLLENNTSFTPEIKQACLIEMAIREPSKYVNILGLTGKKECFYSSSDLFNMNKKEGANSSQWKIGEITNSWEIASTDTVTYFVSDDNADTLNYVFHFPFPAIFDNVSIEIVSNEPYEIFVNRQFAAEGEGTVDNEIDSQAITDLILPEKNNRISVRSINRNKKIPNRIAWKMSFDSYRELETLSEMLIIDE